MTVTRYAVHSRFLGLSTDVKPPEEPVGSTFIETDTGSTYIWDGTAWSLHHDTVDLKNDEVGEAGSVLDEISASLKEVAEWQRQIHWLLSVAFDMEGDAIS